MSRNKKYILKVALVALALPLHAMEDGSKNVKGAGSEFTVTPKSAAERFGMNVLSGICEVILPVIRGVQRVVNGKPIPRERIQEEKEFHDFNTCNEYIRSLNVDTHKSRIEGHFDISYKKRGSDENRKTSAFLSVYTSHPHDPKLFIKNPLSFEQQLDQQLKFYDGDLGQQSESHISDVYIKSFMRYDQVIKPS